MMRRGIVGTLLLSLFLALSSSTSSADGSGPQPAYILRHFTSETIVNPDGTSTSTSHTEVEAANDTAAHRLGERSVSFSESMEDLEILEAVTRKRDGQELPVNPSAIFIQAPQGSSNAPMFSDRKNKIIVFPNVGAGDVVSYTVRTHAKVPYTPGHFSWTRTVSPLWYVEDWQETIIFPKSMPAAVESHQIAHSMEERGDQIAHIFTYRQTSPRARGPRAAFSLRLCTAIFHLDLREPCRIGPSLCAAFSGQGRGYATCRRAR